MTWSNNAALLRRVRRGTLCRNCGRGIEPCELNPHGLIGGDRCGIGFVHTATGLHYCSDPGDVPASERWTRWAMPDPE